MRSTTGTPHQLGIAMLLRRALAPAALFSGALSIRLLYLAEFRGDVLRDFVGPPWRAWVLYDAAGYHQVATEIVRGDWLGETPYFLSPLYGQLVAAVYACFGVGLEPVRIVQAFVGAASCVLVYEIGRTVFSEAAGVIGACLFALLGTHVFYTGMILPTTLVVFLNLVFLRIALHLVARPTPAWACLAGAVLGLAVATKPNAILMWPITIALLWVQARPRDSRAFLGWASAFSIGVCIVMTPVVVHDGLASGEVVLLGTTGGRNLMKGNGPTANGTHVFSLGRFDGPALGAHLDGRIEGADSVHEDRRLRAAALRYMADHPTRTLRLMTKKALLFVNARELFVRDDSDFARTCSRILAWTLPGFALIGTLGLVGAATSWRGLREGRLIHGMLLAQLVSYTLIFVLARYRLVAVACLAVFAGQLIVEMTQQLRARAARSLAIRVTALAITAGLVALPFHEFPHGRGFETQRRLVTERTRLLEADAPHETGHSPPTDGPALGGR